MDHIFWLFLIMAAVFILSGLIINKYPNLIAGYRNLSLEKKKTIDTKKLASHLRLGFVITGCFILLAYFLLRQFHSSHYDLLALLMLPMLGLFITYATLPKLSKSS
jgi:hypothetical protein